MATSQHDNRDPLISASKVGISLQFRMLLQKAPARILGFGPVLAKDAVADLTAVHHLAQSFLNRNPDVSTRASGAVSMNDLEKGSALPLGNRQLAFQSLQRFANRRHIGFEVDELNRSSFVNLLVQD